MKEIITGRLEYKNVEFLFVFDGEVLRLIPPKEKEQEIKFEWIKAPLGDGVYMEGKKCIMNEPFLKGVCNENGHHFIFFTTVGDTIRNKDVILFINIYGYIDLNLKKVEICKIKFMCPEINYIYPSNQALDIISDDKDISENGIIALKTKGIDSAKTDKRDFIVDDIKVSVFFGISKVLNTGIDEAPLTINSSMNFEFEATSNYSFIMRLCEIAREFIRLLCYRKNVAWSKVELYSRTNEKKIFKLGELFIVENQEQKDTNTLEKGTYINQKYIDGYEGKILSDLARSVLYTRHIPETYITGTKIDASRFIMITSAFEWEFDRRYPDGVPKKDDTIKIEKQAEMAIQDLIDKSRGKLKSKYKFLKKLIKSDSLQIKIIKIGEDYDSIIGGLGKKLYDINNIKFSYNDMGERIAKQRNRFAHGDLNINFNGESLCDLKYMEYMIYALQLKGYGVSDENICKSINELFHLNAEL